MKKKAIQILFVAVVPFLFLQLLFIKEFEEPYPSIRFPGFGHVFSADYPRQYVNMLVIVHAADQKQELTMNELLPLTPQYAKVFFKPMSGKLKELPDTLSATSANSTSYDDLMVYLKQSALTKTTFDDIDKITLQWYQYKISKPNTQPTVIPMEFKTILFN